MDADVSIDRLQKDLEQMAAIGATPNGGVTRLALSREDKDARDLFREWLEEVGLTVAIDDIGNMYGHLPGADPVIDPVIIGSHLDSVISGGRFDGTLGVLAGLEVLRTLRRQGLATRRRLVLVNWTNEEGVRFTPAMLGSGVIAGKFTREYAYARSDEAGRTLEAELRNIGYLGEETARLQSFHAYVELHIEQGPILEKEGADIGIVEGIQAISWSTCSVEGRAGHAGTTPMALRQDALKGAAALILGGHRLTQELGDDSLFTVGRLIVFPNAINVIPAQVEFSLDLRAPSDEKLDILRRRVEEQVAKVRNQRFRVQWEEFWHSEHTTFASSILVAIERAAEKRSLKTRRLLSGAGHDAKYMADIGPTAMIFVPCHDGRSHSEDEYISPDAAENGLHVLYDVVRMLAA